MDYFSAPSSTSRAGAETVDSATPLYYTSRPSRQQPQSSSSQPSSSHPHRQPLRVNVPGAEHIPPPPGSPEIISSLITSLSVISEPAHSLFEGHGQSLPSSPGEGSFGVDYGAFTLPAVNRLQEGTVALDELAASPPVIRTAPLPSGLSARTAPKSPKSPKSPRREPSVGLRSLLRSSRPSSRGSATSNDDSRSIGNLSVERGQQPPTPELRRQRSLDSWGRKTGRNARGVNGSIERMHSADADRRSSGLGSMRADPSLAGLAITEEPALTDWLEYELRKDRSPSVDSALPHSIPTRDSSLRKTGTNAKRRSVRAKREGDSAVDDIIPEDEVDNSRSRNVSRNRSTSRKESKARHSSKGDSVKNWDDVFTSELASPATLNPPTTRHSAGHLTPHAERGTVDDGLEDGAPFPSVYSTRRRSVTERRKSGRLTPEPGDTLKAKRSSSRVKRLSAAPKNQEEDRATTPEPQVSYERPRSADSIDDSVHSYMTSPRLSQKIRHPQTGRVISFSEVGDPEGSAVFCCVGMGLTRYITAFYDELALTLKLRLITPDRPGVGDSEPYPAGTATTLSWPGKFTFLSATRVAL